MEYESPNPVQKSRLSLKLKPIFVGQLFIMETLGHPAYHYHDGSFNIVLMANEGITPTFISEYAQTKSSEIFVYEDDIEEINNRLKDELTKITRSLSIGNIKKNAIKHTNLLSMQMSNLYKDPFNDDILVNQFQSSRNFSTLLLNNKDIHRSVFRSISNSNYHYTFTQPLLSSVMLLSFLQYLRLFSEKEMENLFLTSYFKDIGMSFIPREKFEIANLDEFDQKLFSKHAENSMLILQGRVPFSEGQLNIIKNHHFLNYKIQSLISHQEIPDDDTYLTGIESTLISAIDILIAMTTHRPYRTPISSFKALELLKKVISDEYPQEYKALVIFLKNFSSR